MGTLDVGPPDEQSDEPVTAVILRRVRPGSENEFERWLHDLYEVAIGFRRHRGMTVIRPRDRQNPEYIVVFSFDSEDNLQRWRDSDERHHWLDRVESLLEGSPTEHYRTGLETLFSVPGHHVVEPPPRWKMWVLSAAAIYALLLAFTLLAGPVLDDRSVPLRFLVTAPTLSALMTWLVMPRLSKRLSRWLYPSD
jgi:uncharacterized protein